jgi:hypothetical protein
LFLPCSDPYPLDDFVSFWNDNFANSPTGDGSEEPAPKRRKIKQEPGIASSSGSKGKGKARVVESATFLPSAHSPVRDASPLSGWTNSEVAPEASSGIIGWEPALTYTLQDLTPLPLSWLDRIPPSSHRGRTMRFPFPPEDCTEEECARRYAARTLATVQYFTYMLRSNAQLAGHEFILRLVENLHPLRYRPPPAVGPTPSLHCEPYPVAVPKLHGNIQWRALLRAYADELPILMHHARSEYGAEDLELLRCGEFREPDFSGLDGFRAVDIYRWITRDSISLVDVKSFEGKVRYRLLFSFCRLNLLFLLPFSPSSFSLCSSPPTNPTRRRTCRRRLTCRRCLPPSPCPVRAETVHWGAAVKSKDPNK